MRARERERLFTKCKLRNIRYYCRERAKTKDVLFFFTMCWMSYERSSAFCFSFFRGTDGASLFSFHGDKYLPCDSGKQRRTPHTTVISFPFHTVKILPYIQASYVATFARARALNSGALCSGGGFENTRGNKNKARVEWCGPNQERAREA